MLYLLCTYEFFLSSYLFIYFLLKINFVTKLYVIFALNTCEYICLSVCQLVRMGYTSCIVQVSFFMITNKKHLLGMYALSTPIYWLGLAYRYLFDGNTNKNKKCLNNTCCIVCIENHKGENLFINEFKSDWKFFCGEWVYHQYESDMPNIFLLKEKIYV